MSPARHGGWHCLCCAHTYRTRSLELASLGNSPVLGCPQAQVSPCGRSSLRIPAPTVNFPPGILSQIQSEHDWSHPRGCLRQRHSVSCYLFPKVPISVTNPLPPPFPLTRSWRAPGSRSLAVTTFSASSCVLSLFSQDNEINITFQKCTKASKREKVFARGRRHNSRWCLIFIFLKQTLAPRGTLQEMGKGNNLSDASTQARALSAKDLTISPRAGNFPPQAAPSSWLTTARSYIALRKRRQFHLGWNE